MSYTRNLQLLPATRYVARVRAWNGLGVASDWSEAIMFDSVGDSLAPSPVSSLVCDFTSPDIMLSWVAPTTSVDGSPLLDFAKYKVSFRSGFSTVSYFTSDVSYIYTFQQNQIDFGFGHPVLTVIVQTVDTSGNLSPAVSITATNPVPLTSTLVAPTLAAGFNIIAVTMTISPDVKDFLSFDLERSQDNFVTSTVVGTINGTTFTDSVSANTTYYYRFKIVDVYNQISTGYSPVASVTTGSVGGLDTVAPKKPTAVSASPNIDVATQIPYVDVTWANPTQDVDLTTLTDLARSELRLLQTTGAGVGTAVNIYATENASRTAHRFTGLVPNSTYTVSVQSYDIVGNASGFTTAVTFTTGSGVVLQDLVQMKFYTGIGSALSFTNTSYATFYSSLTITKRIPTTNLIVQMVGTGWSTVAGVAFFGILIGGTWYDCGMLDFNNINQHLTFAGIVSIPSIPSGACTLQAGVKVQSGAAFNIDANDSLSFVVTEVY